MDKTRAPDSKVYTETTVVLNDNRLQIVLKQTRDLILDIRAALETSAINKTGRE